MREKPIHSILMIGQNYPQGEDSMLKRKPIAIRVVGCLLAMVTIFSLSRIEVRAEGIWPEGPKVKAPSAIVMELNSGAILYEKNSDEVNFPASITKIMTTMLALEHCELDEVVTFSADAVFKNEGNTSHIARDLNEQMTMEECLYAVMLESANECAYAVAEHVGEKLGGNYQTFIDLMNEKAKELGCTNTQFQNSNGLPDENHWTTARDMMLISREAYKNETFRIIMSTRRYVIPPTNKHSDNTYLNNHHQMIHNYKTNENIYEYAIGGKTGYTQAAGATLVSYAEKDGMTLVCVVMRCGADHYYQDTEALFEYCFQSFVNYNIAENETMITEEEQSKGFMNDFGSYVLLDKTATITLPVTAAFSDATCSISQGEKESGRVAELIYTYGDKVVGSTAIVPSGVAVGDNYFSENASQVDGVAHIVKIKPIYIILSFLVLVVLVIIIILIKKLYDNFYLLRHNMERKRQRQSRFRPVNRKRESIRRRRSRRFR